MIVEGLLTRFLKRQYSNILRLTDFEYVQPPAPRGDTKYLLYVHIPFCEELCPYCSFNRFPLDKDLAREYFKALHREIRMYGDIGFDFASVYIGGGTPTVLPREIGELLEDLQKRFGIKEVSLETNPNHLTDEIVTILKHGGVNRLSVGVQSFQDDLLKQMERYHKYGSGQQIQERLTKYAGTFDTLNVDMIFNFPTQTASMLDKDLEVIKNIEADQVTFYPLMVSDITRAELARRFGAISYRQEKAFYNRIVELLQDQYTWGTAWCFSRKKSMIDEYIVDYDEYVGAGSGSFGYVNGACFANTFSIPQYLEAVGKGQWPILAKRDFTKRERALYDFMMKLFGTALDIRKQENKFSGEFMKTLWKEISLFRAAGAIVNDAGFIRLTRRGRYLWVIMMREFFTGVNNFRDICRAAVQASNECMQ